MGDQAEMAASDDAGLKDYAARHRTKLPNSRIRGEAQYTIEARWCGEAWTGKGQAEVSCEKMEAERTVKDIWNSRVYTQKSENRT